MASLWSLVARDLFAVPFFCADIQLLVLEPPDSGIDWNVNRCKRTLARGHLSTHFLENLHRIGRGFFFEFPAALDTFVSLD